MKRIAYFCILFNLMHTAFVCAGSSMAEWNSLLQSNKKFVKNNTFAKQRAPLKNAQNPSVVVLSCADSRVTPEFIFNQKLGSLFVVRVAGPVVDDVVIDSIEFAVATFDVELIVVLGHSNCGAVTGALEHLQKRDGALDKPRGHLNAVLIPIEKAITEAGITLHGAHALTESIHANVQYVANQLTQRSKPLAAAVSSGRVAIVGAEYVLDTGKVHELFSMPQRAL